MNKKITLTGSNKRPYHGKSYSKLYNTVWPIVLFLAIVITGCKKDDFANEITGLCPVVVSTDPMDKAVDVVLNKVVSVTFNTSMKASTISNSTFIIKQGTTVIPGSLAPATNGNTFTFTPSVPLLPFTVYSGTITTGVADTLRTAMVSDYVWSFTTIPQVTVTANPATSGTAAGSGLFAQGSVSTVTATPNTGFIFTNWTDNGTVVSNSSSYQFTMAGNKALVANFAPVPVGNFAVVLSSNPAAGGTTGGSGSYSAGSVATITAFPNAGFTFVNWTEGAAVVSASPSFQTTINTNRTLVANYVVIPASQFAVVLSSNPAAGGTTAGSGAYNSGTSVTVTASANTGYTFSNWTDNGTTVSTSAAYTFPITANRTLVANFTLNTYTLTITSVNGTVVKNPNQGNYNHGSSVSLTATANTGYTFTAWSGDASGTANPLTVSMTSNKNITAVFTAIVIPPLFSSIFGAFGGSAGLTNQGINTVINNGGIGTTGAATLITGFHDGLAPTEIYTETPLNVGDVKGGIFSAPPAPGTASKFTIATQALAAANAFYISISPANRPGGIDPGAGQLGNLTLAPGTYKSASGSFGITSGNLTLDAQGDPNAVWVFQAPTSLTVGIAGAARSIILTNGAQAKNVYWYVGSTATINAAGGGVMVGTIIATAGVTFSTAGNTVQTVLNGRALSLVASVTMVNTTINNP